MSERAGTPVLDLAVGTAPTAHWGARVVATLLDHALVAAVAFVVDAAHAGPGLSVALPLGVDDTVVGPGTLTTVAALLTLQAYLGATPGKMLLGIAVVSDVTGRPVGLLRTVVRWVAHLVDVLLLVGYLRPLWHHDRRTFADSLTGTLALATHAPRPHRWFRGRAADVRHGPPLEWVLPRTPRWRRRLRIPAAALCVLGVLYGCGPTSYHAATTFRAVATCTPPAATGLGEVSLELVTEPAVVQRLGLTYEAADPPTWLVPAWDADDATRPETVRLTIESDGVVAYEADHGAYGWDAGYDARTWPAGHQWQVEALGPDGALAGGCGGTLPSAPPPDVGGSGDVRPLR